MNKGHGWFEASKEGLAALVERRGKTFTVFELIQNAWDEKPREVSVTLELVEGRRGRARLVVEDDSPEGFRDLADAFTLFAPSYKKGDPKLRGRWNLGEKLVLALCDEATVLSTKGGVHFDSTGERRALRRRREAGTQFEAILRMNRDEVQQVAREVFSLIPPAGITTRFNGEVIPVRKAVREFEATLETEIADESTIIRRTKRKTVVRLYQPQADETPSIYEMGIPVVETDCCWHIDVQQKVPLTMDRDNVLPSFHRHLLTEVVNKMAWALDAEEASKPWVTRAWGAKNATDEAVRTVIGKRFGDDAVTSDLSDPEGTKISVSQGRIVVTGGALPKPNWDMVRRAGVLPPAGQVTPSPRLLSGQGGGEPPIPETEWSPGMRRIARYAVEFGKAVLNRPVSVTIHPELYLVPQETPCHRKRKALAAYGRGRLKFSLRGLGRKWFDHPDEQKVNELLIHEFAHEYASDHLSEDYHRALCRVGARLKQVADKVKLS